MLRNLNQRAFIIVKTVNPLLKTCLHYNAHYVEQIRTLLPFTQIIAGMQAVADRDSTWPCGMQVFEFLEMLHEGYVFF